MIRSVHLWFMASLTCSLVFGGNLTCDFDGDGVCDVSDIDMLSIHVELGEPFMPAFDLSDDGITDQDDREAWLASAGIVNGLSEPYLVGDANLDGRVSSLDLNAIGVNWQDRDALRWSEGNFVWAVVDGVGAGVDANDLMILALNWRNSVLPASPVPEPQSLLWLLLASASGVFCFRKQNPIREQSTP